MTERDAHHVCHDRVAWEARPKDKAYGKESSPEIC